MNGVEEAPPPVPEARRGLLGEILIRDTISEHYCLLLHRLGYTPHAIDQTGKGDASQNWHDE